MSRESKRGGGREGVEVGVEPEGERLTGVSGIEPCMDSVERGKG